MIRFDSSHLHQPLTSASKSLRLVIAASWIFVGAACDRLPGKPPPNPAPVISVATTAGFEAMWAERCTGCHGADGQMGAGLPMRNAEYLKAVPDGEMFSIIRDGVPSSRMPGFGGNAIGGVSDEIIRDFIKGMHTTWASSEGSNVSRGISWRPSDATGDIARGATIFAAKCAACHPAEQKVPVLEGAMPDQLIAGSVTDPSYLRLVSDQHLRSNIVFGRTDLGMPGAAGPFRGPDGGEVTGGLDAADVADLVAYLASKRNTWPSGPEVEDGAP
ncbi:MAG: c-type cytochrome [Planctomycetota bacterium]|nr:c-type cytochrome [Planctomycetota bacterium]